MMGKFKIPLLAAIALISFVGYVYLFSIVLGVSIADAVSVMTKGSMKAPAGTEGQVADSTKAAAAQDSVSAEAAKKDSLEQQLAAISTGKKELEALRTEVKTLVETKNQQDQEKLTSLAKIYDGMDPAGLANIMSGISDSLVIEILPKMKSQKVSKILESMPAERAAAISTKLLGKK